MTDRKTLKLADDYANSALLFTYWNSSPYTGQIVLCGRRAVSHRANRSSAACIRRRPFRVEKVAPGAVFLQDPEKDWRKKVRPFSSLESGEKLTGPDVEGHVHYPASVAHAPADGRHDVRRRHGPHLQGNRPTATLKAIRVSGWRPFPASNCRKGRGSSAKELSRKRLLGVVEAAVGPVGVIATDAVAGVGDDKTQFGNAVQVGFQTCRAIGGDRPCRGGRGFRTAACRRRTHWNLIEPISIWASSTPTIDANFAKCLSIR